MSTAGGYIPSSSVYRSSYRTKQFPTLSSNHNNSPVGIDANLGLPLSPMERLDRTMTSSTTSPYRNKYEVPNLQMDSPVGLYNCPQQRTSQAFSSMDDLDALTSTSSTSTLTGATATTSAQYRGYQVRSAQSSFDIIVIMLCFQMKRPIAQYPGVPSGGSRVGSSAAAAIKNSPKSGFATGINNHNHRYVLGFANEALARADKAEEAAARALTENKNNIGGAARYPSLERSSSSVVSRKLTAGGGHHSGSNLAKRELPALPVSATSGSGSIPGAAGTSSSKSMDDLDTLEAAGVHGRAKMNYREVVNKENSSTSHNLANTEEYPPHSHEQKKTSAMTSTSRGYRGYEEGGPYPVHRNSTTLLPGQTYPDQPVKPTAPAITNIQDVFYHREIRMALSNEGSSTATGSAPPPSVPKKKSVIEPPPPTVPKNPMEKRQKEDESPPPPLFPKQYHTVVEQRRRSGLDRPTAVAVPAIVTHHPPPTATIVNSVDVVTNPHGIVGESPAVDRRSKPASTSKNHHDLDSSFDSTSATVASATPAAASGSETSFSKFVPYKETSKPFEMSDFYKYSQKYNSSRKNRESTASESGASTTSSSNDNNSASPPELPVKNSPAKNNGPPPPPPPAKKPLRPPPLSNNNKNSSDSNANNGEETVGDTFSNEMLAWYNTQQSARTKSGSTANAQSTKNLVKSGDDKNKPATLV